ncbi:MAG: hypothetical protein PUH18_00820 [Coriobacteriaceae bacterium]|nr:hypothetical protein [Coriobacteriaceae bacterium]
MATLGCPCGNAIWNGMDGEETEYYFVSFDELRKHWEDMAFFEMMYNSCGTEMWKCDVCDRMMVFDGGSDEVTRYLKRVDPSSIDAIGEGVGGICFNNLLFNEVASDFSEKSRRGGCPEYEFFDDGIEGAPRLTARIMFEEVFSGANGRYRNWWFADMSEDFLLLYSPYDPARRTPVKAWKRYEERYSGDPYAAIGEVADLALDFLAELPDGAEASTNRALSALAGRRPDIELTDRDGFTFGGRRFSFDEEWFDLSGEIFGRAILHGLYLDPSEWQGGPETGIGLPRACPFRVRHLGAK